MRHRAMSEKCQTRKSPHLSHGRRARAAIYRTTCGVPNWHPFSTQGVDWSCWILPLPLFSSFLGEEGLFGLVIDFGSFVCPVDWAINKPEPLATKAAAIITRKIFFTCCSYRPHSIPICEATECSVARRMTLATAEFADSPCRRMAWSCLAWGRFSWLVEGEL